MYRLVVGIAPGADSPARCPQGGERRAREKNAIASQYSMADALFSALFLNACNDVEHPSRVVPEQTALAFSGGVARLAPHSLTVVKFEHHP